MRTPWDPGELIVRREVLGFHRIDPLQHEKDWYGHSWLLLPEIVVQDSETLFATYIAEGTEFGFFDRVWPIEGGRHPWHDRKRWQGPGVLILMRPGDPYSVWHFWNGPNREFTCWYINLQAPLDFTDIGYDTEDYELDLLLYPDGTIEVKDLDVLDQRVAEGRFTPELRDYALELAATVSDEIRTQDWWWDTGWTTWTPPPEWRNPDLPVGWQRFG